MPLPVAKPTIPDDEPKERRGQEGRRQVQAEAGKTEDDAKAAKKPRRQAGRRTLAAIMSCATESTAAKAERGGARPLGPDHPLGHAAAAKVAARRPPRTRLDADQSQDGVTRTRQRGRRPTTVEAGAKAGTEPRTARSSPEAAACPRHPRIDARIDLHGKTKARPTPRCCASCRRRKPTALNSCW